MSTQERWQLSGTAPQVYERSLVPAIFGPWAPVLVERAALQPGEHVLDVACGTGVVARQAAQHVGPTGKVIGLDLNADMLAIARSLPQLPGVSIEWQEGNALTLPFSDETFDVVVCQFGLQYFPDRPSALHEMYRVLVPGGRLALLVWGAIEHCPGYSVLTEALERYIGQASAAIMRAPFSLGDAQQVRALIAGAQFRQVHIRTSVGTVRFASSEDFVQHQVSGSPLAGPVSQADDNARSALLHEVSTALQPYMSRDGLAFPIEAHLVTGRR